MYIKSKFLTCL